MKKFSEIELWKDVSPEEWKNWKWQLSHCINTLEELEKTITISDAEAYGIKETSLDKGTQRKTTENELPSLTQCTA